MSPPPAPLPEVQPADLSSADVERMSGVSAAIQRVWRNRGHLPPLTGTRAKFDIQAAAAIAIRYRLSLQGHAPAATARVGELYAPQLVYFCLMDTTGVCELLAPTNEAVDEAERWFLSDNELALFASGIESGKEPQRFLFGSELGAQIYSNNDLVHAQMELQTPSGVFIDLTILADRFAYEAERPLVSLLFDGARRDSIPPPRRRVVGSRKKGERQT